jgi:hypothetical protein
MMTYDIPPHDVLARDRRVRAFRAAIRRVAASLRRDATKGAPR